MRIAVMRQAAAFHLDAAVVEQCLDPATPADALFVRRRRSGPASLTRAERCAVAGTSGVAVASLTGELLVNVSHHAGYPAGVRLFASGFPETSGPPEAGRPGLYRSAQ
jgi:hypothetical protein